MAGEQILQIVHGHLLTGDGALADAGQHGVGQVQAHVDLVAGGGIAHMKPPAFPLDVEGLRPPLFIGSY